MCIGNLWLEMSKYEDLSGNIEAFVKLYVLPGLASKEPILRIRCCWIYKELCDVKFKDKDHIASSLKGLTDCLFDKFQPVKLEAALAISRYLKHCEMAAEFLKPQL
jgi:hypothetical protein